jgi:hypothetical protein
MGRSRGVDVDADDLAVVVDVQGLGDRGAGEVDGGEPALIPPVGVDRPGLVDPGAHHLAAVVDA